MTFGAPANALPSRTAYQVELRIVDLAPSDQSGAMKDAVLLGWLLIRRIPREDRPFGTIAPGEPIMLYVDGTLAR